MDCIIIYFKVLRLLKDVSICLDSQYIVNRNLHIFLLFHLGYVRKYVALAINYYTYQNLFDILKKLDGLIC